MTDRTFQQHALGFGSETASVEVKIGDTVIYNGPISTVDQPWPSLPDYEYTMENVAWSWQADPNAHGVLDYVIQVTSGNVLMADTRANNPLRDVDIYGRLDTETIGEGEDAESYFYPYVSGARINGIMTSLNPYPWRQGQYWFQLTQGDILELTLNTIASTPPPESEPA
jgi:hypothetical protein